MTVSALGYRPSMKPSQLGYPAVPYLDINILPPRISGFVNTAQIQVSILGHLTSLLKSGAYTSTIGKPKAVVLVGHSTGSFLSNALLAISPHSADAAILTGLGIGAPAALVTEAFNPRIASEQSPKFADRDIAYLTWIDVIANINTYQFSLPRYHLYTNTPQLLQKTPLHPRRRTVRRIS
jgi:hypothetical protein